MLYKNDQQYMRRCIELAKRGQPHPNPYVGAVLVDEKENVVAEGYHKRAGEEHAEVECLKKFKTQISKACPASAKLGAWVKTTTQNLKLYVNLEPCCHWGKTPPCADAIVKAGIKRVVVAMKDPNPLVNGKGIQQLKEAGIEVSSGVLEREAYKLNEQFIAFHKKHRPFIALKTATTLDGKIATQSGDSKWITGEEARNYARSLRARYQAILIGVNTVIKDDPHLGVRNNLYKDSVRIILDSTLKSPINRQVFRDYNVIVATTSRASINSIHTFEKRGVTIWRCAEFKKEVDIADLFSKMVKNQIISVFVEGGGKVLSSFISQGYWDKIYWFLAPKILGDELALSAVGNIRQVKNMQESIQFKDVSHHTFNEDFMIEGYKSD